MAGLQGFGNDSGFGKEFVKDFKDSERILNLNKICERISRYWGGFWIWTGFGQGFRGFGKDSSFGKDLVKASEDLRSILDLDGICSRISRIRRVLWIRRGFVKGFQGFQIWRGCGEGFLRLGEHFGIGRDLLKDVEDAERILDLEMNSQRITAILKGYLHLESVF